MAYKVKLARNRKEIPCSTLHRPLSKKCQKNNVCWLCSQTLKSLFTDQVCSYVDILTMVNTSEVTLFLRCIDLGWHFPSKLLLFTAGKNSWTHLCTHRHSDRTTIACSPATIVCNRSTAKDQHFRLSQRRVKHTDPVRRATICVCCVIRMCYCVGMSHRNKADYTYIHLCQMLLLPEAASTCIFRLPFLMLP